MRQIKLSEAAGKTFAGCVFSSVCSDALILFADGTFACLGVDTGYERGDETIEEGTLSPLNFGDTLLVGHGVYSQAELDAIRNERDEKSKVAREAYELQEFQRLRAKFGG
jgi:hypothetical protein